MQREKVHSSSNDAQPPIVPRNACHTHSLQSIFDLRLNSTSRRKFQFDFTQHAVDVSIVHFYLQIWILAQLRDTFCESFCDMSVPGMMFLCFYQSLDT